MNKKFNIICVLTMSFILSGCGATKTMVLEPIETQDTVKKLRIEKDKSTTIVEPEVEKCFEENLHEQLFKDAGFQEGNDITLKYRFLQMNEGSRFKRWMTGGIGNCGEGSSTVEVRFIDNTKNAKEIGKIHAQGTIGSGIFGGSMDSSVKSVAEEVATYAKTNFKVN